MQDFLTDYYTFLTKFVEFIAAITGILVYKKYKNTSAKYFIWLLIGVAIMELVGGYTVYIDRFESLHHLKTYLEGTRFEKNSWVYTIFWKIGATLFFAWYFRKLLISTSYKLLLKIGSGLFLIIALTAIAMNFELFFRKSLTVINISGGILIICSVTLYLIEVLQSEKILDFYKSLNFYIAAALFIWFIITTPLIFYDIYFSRKDMPYVTLKMATKLFCNIFMYSTFTLALIWCKPEKQ